MEIILFIYPVTFFSSLLITSLAYMHWEKFSNIGLDPFSEIQKLHNKNSFRLGGCILMLSIILVGLIFKVLDLKTVFSMLCLAPMFFIALIEDFFGGVSIAARFTSSIISALLLVLVTNVQLNYIDINIIDFLLSYKVMAITFTAIGITITANSWNFIDGLNGVSSGLASIVLIAILSLYNSENINSIDIFLYMLSGACLGIWVINQFFGKIFMGDAGAYFVGSIIGWAGVNITHKNEYISPWIIFFIIIYPATEFCVSFFRRVTKKNNPTKADNKHLHTLLYRAVLNLYGKKLISKTNSYCGGLILLFASLPSIYIIFFEETLLSVSIGMILFIFAYLTIYLLLNIYIDRNKIN